MRIGYKNPVPTTRSGYAYQYAPPDQDVDEQDEIETCCLCLEEYPQDDMRMCSDVRTHRVYMVCDYCADSNQDDIYYMNMDMKLKTKYGNKQTENAPIQN